MAWSRQSEWSQRARLSIKTHETIPMRIDIDYSEIFAKPDSHLFSSTYSNL